MKSSRALLFAALIAVTAPAFASEGTQNQQNTQQQNPPASTTPPATPPAVEPSVFSKIVNFAAAPFVFVVATAPDRIAKETFGRIAAIECLKGGNIASVLNHKWTGRLAVYATAVALYLQISKMYNQAQDDNDDQQLLFEEENN